MYDKMDPKKIMANLKKNHEIIIPLLRKQSDHAFGYGPALSEAEELELANSTRKANKCLEEADKRKLPEVAGYNYY